MSRLSDLYKAMETLRKEGLPVGEDLERKANELEEEIIKKEILPVLTKTIEPALQPVKRELVLVVDYVCLVSHSAFISRVNATLRLKFPMPKRLYSTQRWSMGIATPIKKRKSSVRLPPTSLLDSLMEQ